MHLKGLVTHFQKMVLFIILWLTILVLMAFEVEESYQISAKLSFFSIL